MTDAEIMKVWDSLGLRTRFSKYLMDFARALLSAQNDKDQSVNQGEPVGTPANRWSLKGEPDPHAGQYDCERAALSLGSYTDDELANAVYMHDHRTLNLQAIIAGEPSSIGLLTAAKERIRWLSRALARAQSGCAASQRNEPPKTVAFEFRNLATGHAIVDYTEHTHVGHLTAENGYVAYPLTYNVAAHRANQRATLDKGISNMRDALKDQAE